jgi:hypothetical protein
MRQRILVTLLVLTTAWASAHAAGRVLDGAPVPLNNAQTWCVSPLSPLPNWDGPAHPDCKMVWRVLAERNGRILYSARYAWPSPTRSEKPVRMLSEVLYEGARGSSVVHRLFAVQDDEAHVRLEPLRVVTVGDTAIIESRVCMSDTGECGRELAAWSGGRIAMIRDRTVAELRSKLPKGYDIKLNPEIDLMSLKGSGKAWAKGDADCCPSASLAFTVELDSGELHLGAVTFQKRGESPLLLTDANQGAVTESRHDSR